MSAPVLVIHGVANRSEPEFVARVRQLAEDVGRDPASLIPVYWGDLGARTDGLADTIPSMAATGVRAVAEAAGDGIDAEWAMSLLAASNGGGVAVRGTADDAEARASVAADAFVARAPAPAAAGAGGEAAVRSDATSDDEVRQAVIDEWTDTTYLKAIAHEDVLRELGAAAAEAAGAGDGTAGADDGAAVRGLHLPHVNVRERIHDAVHALDRAVGAVLGEVGGRVNTFLRTELGPHIGEFLGDIIVYHAHRADIHARVRAALAAHAPDQGTPDRPVSILGHSLGGVIAFDLAVAADPPLSIDHLVTFGSQSPLLHVVDPRVPMVPAFVPPTPSPLPATIGRWTNLWEPRDPLAFIAAKVFVLASGKPPTDVAVASLVSSGLWTHSSYWGLAELADVVRADVP